MQGLVEEKENSEERFADIDSKWSRVQDAIRLQTQERNQDISELTEQLKKHVKFNGSLQEQKKQVQFMVVQMTLKRVTEMNRDASEIKQNLEKHIEGEAEFRIQHIDKKNLWIQNHSQVRLVSNIGRKRVYSEFARVLYQPSWRFRAEAIKN